MNKIVLITGATGFLGYHLLKELSGENVKLRGFYFYRDNQAWVKELQNTFDVELIGGDIARKDHVRDVLKDVSAVFHASASVSFFRKDRELQYLINVEGTRNILEESLNANVEKFVHISSVNALGYPENIGNENTEYNWGFFAPSYMKTKMLAEKEVEKAVQKGLDAVIVSPTTMFGSFDVNFNAGKYIIEISKGNLFFYPAGGTNIVSVNDAAKGIICAWKNGRKGERYILGCENISYRNLFRKIADLLGRKRFFMRLPFLPAFCFCLIAEFSLNKAGIYPPFSSDMILGGSKKLYYSHEKSKKELGYNPVSADNAIIEAIEWYRERGVI